MTFRTMGFLLLLGACGGTDAAPDAAAVNPDSAPPSPAASAPPAGAIVIDATLAEWTVELSQDSVPAGVVTINVRNRGTAAHALQISGTGQDVGTDQLAAGADVTMSLDLTAGEYRLYCPVDSAGVKHETKGMTKTLRVY